MIGSLTIDKASMNLSYFLNTVRIIHINGGHISRQDFVHQMAEFIGVPAQKDGKENRTPYNKSKLPRYFGFVDIDTDDQGISYLVLTNRGKKLVQFIDEKDTDNPSQKYYINSGHRDEFIDLIFESVIFDSFGKNNCGAEQSSTDVEPPKIVFKTIQTLERATAEEICYVMFGLNKGEFITFDDAIAQVKKNRNNFQYDYSKIMEEWKLTNIVNDCKIINIFTDDSIQLLTSSRDEELDKVFYYLSPSLNQRHLDQISAINAIYQPLRLFVYTDGNNTSIQEWVHDAVLGRVSDEAYVFKYSANQALYGNASVDPFIPGVLETALLKAFQKPQKNVFLILNHVTEEKLPDLLGPYFSLLQRTDDLSSERHGWSSSPIEYRKVYDFIIQNCSEAKRLLDNGKVSIPSNLQIAGTIIMENTDKNKKFDYEFTRALVKTNEEYSKSLIFNTDIDLSVPRNRIFFGAPGTGKSFKLNEDRKKLLGTDNETDYERVTFHPDYSYANFVGTYKPVMTSKKTVSVDKDTDYVISILNDGGKTAQEKYDVLFEKFKDEGLTRLPMLLGLYTDEMFKTRKQDGSDAVGDNSVERNHGKAIRKYVNLLTGQETSSDIAYEYVPGPFMRVYVNALKSAKTKSPKPYLLLIEEINRANVAAVFGDIFQLLDRDENEVSEYPIQASEDIKKYLAKELGGNPEDYNKIKIPNNMFIWGTMNSADQGVFPMDTAFKRRWDFTYIGIDDNDEEIRGKYVILGNGTSQKVEWNKLRKAINHFLAKQKINEDKQLGPYFLSRKVVIPESGDEIDKDRFCEAFKNKVIMYLFEDAAKQKRPSLFEGCFDNSSRYSEICREFDEKGVGIFNHDIGIETDPVDIKINDKDTDGPVKETE